MKFPRRTFLHLATGAAALLSRIAWAQTYPSRPVTIIVPVPPGGVADPIARILADHLTEQGNTFRSASISRQVSPAQLTTNHPALLLARPSAGARHT
jgi:hypothetical protein